MKKNIKRKMKEEIKALEISLKLRKEMIWCEVEFLELKRELNLNHYELQQLTLGRLSADKMEKVWEYLNEISDKVKKRNATYKRFKVILLDNGFDFKDAVEFIGITPRRLRAILTGERVERQPEVEKKIEEFCRQKLFL